MTFFKTKKPTLSAASIVALSLSLFSCVPHKSLINYSETKELPDEPQEITNLQPIRIQASDILQINVSSPDEATNAIFNEGSGQYLVSSLGNIDVPFIGKVNLEGLTIDESKDFLQKKLNVFFVQPPIVNMQLVNFTINVHGEVNNPGSFVIQDGRVSILDALIQAGDFTSYSSREDILLIREEGNIRTFSTIDFNSLDVMNSPFFYLQQNDVIYVKPKKRKGASVSGTSDKLLTFGQFTLGLALFLTAIFNLR